MANSSTDCDEVSPLRVVVIKDGESLPQFCAPWTFRAGNLSAELARRGHSVTWFASTFRHNEKEFYELEDTVEEREEGYRMHFLHSGGYTSNISFARWRHHVRLAGGVYRALREGQPPDVIVCCIPILEVAAACHWYCKKRGIPLILDIRDPWPRIFVDYAPAALRPLVRLALTPYFAGTAHMFASVESLVSVSRGFLNWAHNMSGRSDRNKVWDRVIYHGAHRAAESIPADEMVATSGLRSLYMGAFSGAYDFEPLVALMTAQAANGSDHHLFLVGQGGKRYQELLTRLGGLPNVTFTGWLPRQQVYGLAKTCHLGWMPVDEVADEYMPNKLFEYPALGLPVATAGRGEPAALVEDHDIGFHYGDFSDSELLGKVTALRPGLGELERWRSHCESFSREVGDAQGCARQYAVHIENLAAHYALTRRS